jgi:hypothetical protein
VPPPVFSSSCVFCFYHRGQGGELITSGARAFGLASCAAGDFFGLLAPVPRLWDHTPAPQGRKAAGGKLRRTAGGLHFLGGELR